MEKSSNQRDPLHKTGMIVEDNRTYTTNELSTLRCKWVEFFYYAFGYYMLSGPNRSFFIMSKYYYNFDFYETCLVMSKIRFLWLFLMVHRATTLAFFPLSAFSSNPLFTTESGRCSTLSSLQHSCKNKRNQVQTRRSCSQQHMSSSLPIL